LPKRILQQSRRDPRLVAALVYPDLCTFEFGITAEIFGLPRPEMGPDWYRFITCSEDAAPVSAMGGIEVRAMRRLSAFDQAGTIVIPGWGSNRPPCSPALARALKRAHADGARIVTLCSGAFLASELGLLNGRKATTHWRYADVMRTRFPEVDLTPDVLFIDNSDVLTSAGSAAGVDLLLHIVRKDFGSKAANTVARRLVVPPLRTGGQKQFIETPVPAPRHDRMSDLCEQVRRHPAKDWNLAAMARFSAMSERSFSRRFRELTGSAPGEWLIAERVTLAKRMLESGAATLDAVAERTGLGTPENLIRQFRKRTGVTPQAYRRTFSLTAA
jgi:AraC family transcriptional activator FtrA